MVGASARYSCLHIPVETGTSPFSIRIEAGGGRLCWFPTADIVLIVVRLFAESARCVFAVSRPVTLYRSERSNQLISAVVIFRSLTGEAAVLGCGRSRTLHYHYILLTPLRVRDSQRRRFLQLPSSLPVCGWAYRCGRSCNLRSCRHSPCPR